MYETNKDAANSELVVWIEPPRLCLFVSREEGKKNYKKKAQIEMAYVDSIHPLGIRVNIHRCKRAVRVYM